MPGIELKALSFLRVFTEITGMYLVAQGALLCLRAARLSRTLSLNCFASLRAGGLIDIHKLFPYRILSSPDLLIEFASARMRPLRERWMSGLSRTPGKRV